MSGCTPDPEDGVKEGEQDPADASVTPEGWTNIKQYNQRSTTPNGNTQKTGTVSVAVPYGKFVFLRNIYVTSDEVPLEI